jgi:hypothetical protein
MADPARKAKFNGPCPFCGNFVEESDVDPCRVTVETQSGKPQVWFCHAACFKAKIVDNPFIDLSPAHF